MIDLVGGLVAGLALVALAYFCGAGGTILNRLLGLPPWRSLPVFAEDRFTLTMIVWFGLQCVIGLPFSQYLWVVWLVWGALLVTKSARLYRHLSRHGELVSGKVTKKSTKVGHGRGAWAAHFLTVETAESDSRELKVPPNAYYTFQEGETIELLIDPQRPSRWQILRPGAKVPMRGGVLAFAAVHNLETSEGSLSLLKKLRSEVLEPRDLKMAEGGMPRGFRGSISHKSHRVLTDEEVAAVRAWFEETKLIERFVLEGPMDPTQFLRNSMTIESYPEYQLGEEFCD